MSVETAIPDYTIKKRNLFQHFCLWFMTTLGWEIDDDLPDEPRYLVIAAPHTSNWDFFLGLVTMEAMRLPLRWVGKHTIFRWPWAWFFRYVLGGIAVDRRKSSNFVDQIVELYREADRLALVMAPEGTRSGTKYWKTGFYWIAYGAQIPIMFAYMDWNTKKCGAGPVLWPTGDIDADFEIIKDFYSHKAGLRPHRMSEIAIPPVSERRKS